MTVSLKKDRACHSVLGERPSGVERKPDGQPEKPDLHDLGRALGPWKSPDPVKHASFIEPVIGALSVLRTHAPVVGTSAHARVERTFQRGDAEF